MMAAIGDSATATLRRAKVLLCDADGNLFPSEEPAFEASAVLVNRFLADFGVDRAFSPSELRRAAVGRNFRSMALALAAHHGLVVQTDEIERYVAEERRAVVAHLRRELRPDPDVLEPLAELSRRFRLTIVSSSALSRLDACFEVTDLSDFFAPEVRFSAEDSLTVPTSKPDPAVYTHAGQALGVTGDEAIAIEDAPAGVESARRAGFPVVGNLAFVAQDERSERAADLLAAGAAAVFDSWSPLTAALTSVESGESGRGRVAGFRDGATTAGKRGA